MRLKLTIAYDGRPFSGWQSQPGGNTVQDILERAITVVCKAGRIAVHGSGRTDAGVHAHAQVAHFDPPEASRMDPPAWLRALNANLPPTIRILGCEEVAPDFHARFSARRKEYRYRIHTGPILSPLEHGLAWHLPRGLDAPRLEQACRLFVGTWDFRNFAARRGDEPSAGQQDPARTTRTLYSVSLASVDPGLLEISFCGDGFLYKMVRLLTGSAVLCARSSARDLDWLRSLLEKPGEAGVHGAFAAPADGLYLVEVTYR